jgi:hypothetical protein
MFSSLAHTAKCILPTLLEVRTQFKDLDTAKKLTGNISKKFDECNRIANGTSQFDYNRSSLEFLLKLASSAQHILGICVTEVTAQNQEVLQLCFVSEIDEFNSNKVSLLKLTSQSDYHCLISNF